MRIRIAVHKLLELGALTLTIMLMPTAWTGASAAKLKVLHSFCEKPGCLDGSRPVGGLVTDGQGNFFGTTATGGTGHGAAFELQRTESGKLKFKKLYKFCPGHACNGRAQNPRGSLIVDVQGNLYGMADGGAGGRGVIFKLSRNKAGKWLETDLYGFCALANCADGATPVGGLTYAGANLGSFYDGASALFGTATEGGQFSGGVAFSLQLNGGAWSESVIYDFCSQGGANCLDGLQPSGGLMFDQAGHLLGATFEGGGNDVGVHTRGGGVLFELAPAESGRWSEAVLYRFCSGEACADGAAPIGRLSADAAGNLFGIALNGGLSCAPDKSFGCGVVFKIALNSGNASETVLHAFCERKDCRDGQSPVGELAVDAAGTIIGATAYGGGNDSDVDGLGGGTIFRIAGSSFKVLHSFCDLQSCGDGAYPGGGLGLEAAGTLIATTTAGGSFATELNGGAVSQFKY